MCSPVMAVGAGLGAASSLLGDYQQTKAVEAQIKGSRLQTREMLKSLNYADASAKLEQKQLMDETVAKLSTANMDRIRNMGTINAAIGESNLEGRSMDRVAMVMEGDMLREAAGLTEDYHRDYATILGKRYGQTASTKSQINLMNKSESKMPSYLLRALNVGVGSAKGAVAASSFKGA